MSISTLSHSFRKATGKKLSDYVAELRIRRAIELLNDRERTILEITQLVGYSSVPSFITTFKNHVGMTPGEYQSHYAWAE